MSFSADQGYIPASIADLMDLVRAEINVQFGTTYDADTFLGTNFYKYFYALIQELQLNEVKTSEIVLKLQQYFSVTNEAITRPNTTNPGVIDYLTALGYTASVKPPADADAGKIYVAVDLSDNHARGNFTITNYANLLTGGADTVTVGATVFTAQSGVATPGTATFRAATSNDYTAASLAAQINSHATAGALVEAEAQAAIVYLRAKTGGTGGNSIALAYTEGGSGTGLTKSGTVLAGGRALATDEDDYDVAKVEICTAIKDSVVAGVVSQGNEIETLALSNGQSFDFKFTLPDVHALKWRLTIVQSAGNQYTVLTPDEIKALLFSNLTARIRLGLPLEPQRYFSIVDAPWAASVLLEYSLNGGADWLTAVYASEFDDKFSFELTDIQLVES